MEIITASYFLPMTNGCPVIKNGAIAVELGKILATGQLEELKTRYPEAEVKSYPDCVLMPGLINSHCHLDLVSFYESQRPADEDYAPPLTDFADLLVSTIDYKHDANPVAILDGIQKGVARLIETGTTCIGDMTHFEGTFKILREMGIRAVVFPEILAGRGEAAQQKFEIALALAEKYTDASHDRVRVGLGPYATYLLSRNLLKIIAQHAKEASIPLMIHAAESFAEMEFFFDSQGPIAAEVFPSLGWDELPPAQRKTPVEYLADIGFFDAQTTIIGGMHLSARDFPTLARHMVRVVWCPTTNRILKHGSFPFTKLSENGIPAAFGTDYWPPRRGYNLWEEMRLAREEGAAPSLSTPLPAKEILKIATIGGARALWIDHVTGSLEENKKADYIIVDTRTKEDKLDPEYIYEHLITRTEPHSVRQVVVGGTILKRQ